MNKVTFTITSCGRFDLLTKAIDSFLQCNLYPIDRFLLSEDSGDVGIYQKIRKKYGKLFDVIVFNKNKPKQELAILDQMYQHVQTPLVFHCEDDWYFHNEHKIDFIKNSIDILKGNPKILQVHIRDENTRAGQKVGNTFHITKTGVRYRYLTRWGEWNGFSLNPGVRRLIDYQLIQPFSQFAQPATKTHGAWVLTEKNIAEAYTNKGFRGVHLGNFCSHTGHNRSVCEPAK